MKNIQKKDRVEQPKKQIKKLFIDEKLAIKLIMDCRTTSAHKFRTRLGFKQYDVILTKEQSVLTKIMSSFVLNYRIFMNYRSSCFKL